MEWILLTRRLKKDEVFWTETSITLLAHFLLLKYFYSGKNMNVSLGKKWEQFVEAKVHSGDYQTASEVLRDGLRLLEKEALLKRISVSSLAELETRLVEAAESLDAGRGADGEQVFARLRQRSKTRRQNAKNHSL
jgi:antitoxin ParD1/3/4